MSTHIRRGLVAVAAGFFALGASLAGAQGHHHERHHRGGAHGLEVTGVIAQVKERLALDSSQQVLWDRAVDATKAAREAAQPYTFEVMAGAYMSLYEHLLKSPDTQ